MEGNVRGLMPRIRLLVAYVCFSVLLSAASDRVKNIRHEELTKDELVSIYELPVQDEPAGKYVWEYDAPTYVRAVLEKREGKGEWKKLMMPSRNLPEISSYVIIHLKKLKERRPDGQWSILMNLRMGGSGPNKLLGQISGWSKSVAMLTYPSLDYQCTIGPNPEALLLMVSENVTYRLRLETSAQPFPGN
jgi:hypothetical protein